MQTFRKFQIEYNVKLVKECWKKGYWKDLCHYSFRLVKLVFGLTK